EDAMAGIEGIDTINARSSICRAQVSIDFSSNRDIEAAANDVRDAVSRGADRMPEVARPAEIAKVESDALAVEWGNMSA
uniref:efflux RND transporter permease subunit n=1 Tax=Stenotrophomonas sp. SrG TaxID=3414430 RepID=UPI003CF053D4